MFGFQSWISGILLDSAAGLQFLNFSCGLQFVIIYWIIFGRIFGRSSCRLGGAKPYGRKKTNAESQCAGTPKSITTKAETKRAMQEFLNISRFPQVVALLMAHIYQ